MAGTEKRQLILDLLARNKMGSETTAAARDVDKVGDAAEKASHKTEDFGKASYIAGEGAGRLGKEADKTGHQVDKLTGEIELAKKELQSLARSFAETDDAAERLDISKGIRKGENDIRRLTKSKGLLEGLLPDPDPGETKKWTDKLTSQINSGLASSGPLMGGGAIIAGILAPTVAGALAGAVVGGIGIGGVIGGLALVAKDPAISGWATNIGKDFSAKVNASAKDAFLAPAQDSMAKLEALANRTAPKIGKIFSNTAPGVDQLTDSVVHAADALVDSFVNASAQSGPAMAALGRIIDGTSQSVADFIDMLASHSDEGASSLDDLNEGLQNIITVTTGVVGALATMKGAFDDADSWIDKQRYALEDHSFALDLTADGYKKGSEAAKLYRDGVIGVSGSFNDYDHYIEGATAKTNALATAHSNADAAASGQRDALVGLSSELKAETDPVFGLLNAQQKLDNAQKAVAKSTKEHGKNSAETKAALRDLALAAIDLQGRAGGLSGSFTGSLTPAMRSTLKAAGLTEDQINGIAGEFKAAKKAGDAYARTYAATAKLTTIYKTIRETQNQNYPGNSVTGARASGGPIMRGTPYLVGENGPEIVVPNAAGRVLSAAATRGFASSGGSPVGTSGGAMASGSQRIQIELVGQHEVVSAFRGLIRTANLLQDA
jgi:methyl-accepting chemotaxis protein